MTGLFKFQWLLKAKFFPNIIWVKIGKKEKSLENTLEINGMTQLFKLQWLFHPKF